MGENYYCDWCNNFEYSEGNTLHRLDDGTDLCDSCFENRQEKCECGKLTRANELTEIEGMKLCPPCVKEYFESEAEEAYATAPDLETAFARLMEIGEKQDRVNPTT